MSENGENGGFYRDKTWELLMEEIREIKSSQKAMAVDIAGIKSKLQWVFGLAAGVTLVVNVIWQWILAKTTGGK